MTNEQKAQQLELAAKIVREGLEWEFQSWCGKHWHNGLEFYPSILVALSDGRIIRIKPAAPAPQPWISYVGGSLRV